MNLDYELIFFWALVICALIALVDRLFLAPKRKNTAKHKPLIVEYAYSFWPILLLVFSLRSFAYAPYVIPSGSLKPTLLVGDFIFVNKYDYGIRLPITHKKIIANSDPKRGDIVVFREPPNESRILIKRVIGLPGDHIQYQNKVITINGKTISQKFEKISSDQDKGQESWEVTQKKENLFGVEHGIYQIPTRASEDFDLIVPQGKYFMMGDNRDDSADSRSWGFLPEENIIGKATRIWMSYDAPTHPVRWERLGKQIV